ncbi:MAG: tetratricopeptide repeat protein [Planctomycetes bacterium]|nr:tetratricopeptide repeat protein [Planctomycetota bacterium]MBL7040366.1 tetratricopeptide repeat protein [Pirellulaceae bacterium]
MIRKCSFGLLVACVSVALLACPVRAENEGLADLDKANELKIGAKSLADLEKVSKLCESALKKGLDEANREFATKLLTATLYQHAQRLCGPVLEQSPPDRRWPVLRQFALRDLEKVVTRDPGFGDAHMLIGRLNVLPGGDRERAIKAASAAASAFDENRTQKAAAIVLRAQLREKTEARLEDYSQAIQLDPTNADAWKGRALTYMDQGDFDKAIADFNSLIENDEENTTARLALAEALTNMEKFDEALKHVEKAIKLKPDSSLAYTLRARLHLIKDDAKAALADLDKALKVQPHDISALLIRARVHVSEENLDAAKDDVERALILSPNLPQALLIRSLILAEQGKPGDAVADMKSLLQRDPENVPWRMQLAGLYLQDDQPSKAIEIFTKILAEDETNWLARQARADTLLSVGDHKEAIADFEIVFKQQPENDSILNNFAWVLATSPVDELRDGKRAITLATKACEVTEYKKPHILSTLAAAYAETGDFKTAIKWSTKAVELGSGDEEVDEQLKKELESYQQKKPWREEQTVEEKEDPLQPRRSKFEA